MSMSDSSAECGVLAGIFAHGSEAYLDVADLITQHTMTVDINSVIYDCLEHILKDNPNARPDYAGVMSAARSLGLDRAFEDREDIKQLRGIINMAPLTQLSTVRRLAAKIRKLEIGRLLHAQLARSQSTLEDISGDEPIAHIMGLVENPIFDLTSTLTDTVGKSVMPMGEGALEYVRHLMGNPRQMVGLSSGLDLYDESIGGGLRAGGFDIVAARQKAGKTFVGDNVGLHVARQGIPVLNVDKEMTQEEHLNRVMAIMTGITSKKIEQGECGSRASDRKKLEEAAVALAGLPYHYLPAMGMQDEDVLAFMRRWVTRTVGLDENGKARPCLIIYDWLKLSSAQDLSRNIQEYQMLGFLTSSLKNFMGRYGVSCLCFAQLNREGIDGEDTSVIRGSDRILDFCTSFSIYKWKSDTEMAEETGSEVRYTHKLIPVIARHGPGLKDGDYINIASNYAVGTIAEGPTRNGLGGKATRTKGQIEVNTDGADSFTPGQAEGPEQGETEAGEAA